MTSPLLALFVRSLAEEARSKATYWFRIALSGLAVLLLVFIALPGIMVNSAGQVFFGIMAFLQMAAISIVGLSYFGSAITEEKEDQTLGLLRMTDLNGVSILLGKSTSRLCGALLLLATAAPFTIVAITLGGVSLRQVLATYCVLGPYTFLVANVALLGSVLARRTATATTFTAILGGAMFLGGPLVAWIGSLSSNPALVARWRKFGEAWGDITPMGRLAHASETGFAEPVFGWPEAGNLLLGVLFFLLAWLVFDIFSEHTPAEAGSAAGSKRRWFGLSPRVHSRPAAYPVPWKDFHFLHGSTRGLMLRLVGYVVIPAVVYAALVLSNSPRFMSVMSTFDFWWSAAFVLDTGLMVGRTFRSEINEQTLSALATLPTTLRRVAWRKLQTFVLLSVPGYIAVLCIKVLPTWYDRVYRGSGVSLRGELFACFEYSYMLLLFLALVLALSLLMKRGAVAVAVIGTLVLFFLLQIGQMLLLTRLFAASGMYSAAQWSQHLLGLPFAILVTIFVLRWSLRRLDSLAGQE